MQCIRSVINFTFKVVPFICILNKILSTFMFLFNLNCIELHYFFCTYILAPYILRKLKKNYFSLISTLQYVLLLFVLFYLFDGHCWG